MGFSHVYACLGGETSHGLAHSSVVGGAEHEPRMTPLRRDPSTLDTRFVTPGTLDPFATQVATSLFRGTFDDVSSCLLG
jgi:hypothetical protein